MARRKAKRKTRRRKTGVSLVNLAETYMLTNVATQTLFNVNPWTFLVGDSTGMTAKGFQQLSIKEVFSAKQGSLPTTQVIQKNFSQNWMTGVAGMVLIPISFRIGKALARPAISKTNRLLGKVGISKTVKV